MPVSSEALPCVLGHSSSSFTHSNERSLYSELFWSALPCCLRAEILSRDIDCKKSRDDRRDEDHEGKISRFGSRLVTLLLPLGRET
jgi:hypothetical protein